MCGMAESRHLLATQYVNVMGHSLLPAPQTHKRLSQTEHAHHFHWRPHEAFPYLKQTLHKYRPSQQRKLMQGQNMTMLNRLSPQQKKKVI